MLNEVTYNFFIYGLAFGGSSFRGVLHLTVTLQNAFEERCDCRQRWEPDYYDSYWSPPHHSQEYDDCGRHVDIHFDRGIAQDRERRKLERILMSMRFAMASGFRNLSTLSLTIKNEPSDGAFCYCHESILGPRYFADILRALPRTCTGLELDTGAADMEHRRDFSTFKHTSLCEALGAVLPQLQHIHIRVASICPDFFYDPHMGLPLHLKASPAQTWATICNPPLPNNYSCGTGTDPIREHADYWGPTIDMWEWQEWSHLPETEQTVCPRLEKIEIQLSPDKCPDVERDPRCPNETYPNNIADKASE